MAEGVGGRHRPHEKKRPPPNVSFRPRALFYIFTVHSFIWLKAYSAETFEPCSLARACKIILSH